MCDDNRNAMARSTFPKLKKNVVGNVYRSPNGDITDALTKVHAFFEKKEENAISCMESKMKMTSRTFIRICPQT